MKPIFENSFGEIDSDSIKINKKDFCTKIKTLAYAEVKLQRLKLHKIFSLIMIIVGVVTFQFELNDFLNTFVILPSIILFLSICLFLEFGYYFVCIVHTNASITQIRIKRSELKEANDLINEFNTYRSFLIEIE